CAELVKDLEAFGLANDKLSFLEPEPEAAAKVAGAAPSGASKPGQTKAAVSATKASGVGPGAKGPPTAKPPSREIDQWDLSYRNRKGKLVKKRLSTAQVRELIKDDNFDLKAQAKRADQKNYRALATFTEFEAVLRGKIAKEEADRKS